MKISKKETSLIFEAIRNDNSSLLMSYIFKGIPLDLLNETGENLLEVAVENNSIKSLESLINFQGLIINTKNPKIDILDLSLEKNNPEVITMILNYFSKNKVNLKEHQIEKINLLSGNSVMEKPFIKTITDELLKSFSPNPKNIIEKNSAKGTPEIIINNEKKPIIENKKDNIVNKEPIKTSLVEALKFDIENKKITNDNKAVFIEKFKQILNEDIQLEIIDFAIAKKNPYALALTENINISSNNTSKIDVLIDKADKNNFEKTSVLLKTIKNIKREIKLDKNKEVKEFSFKNLSVFIKDGKPIIILDGKARLDLFKITTIGDFIKLESKDGFVLRFDKKTSTFYTDSLKDFDTFILNNKITSIDYKSSIEEDLKNNNINPSNENSFIEKLQNISNPKDFISILETALKSKNPYAFTIVKNMKKDISILNDLKTLGEITKNIGMQKTYNEIIKVIDEIAPNIKKEFNEISFKNDMGKVFSPKQIENIKICYKGILDAEKKYKIPRNVLLGLIKTESDFVFSIKPFREPDGKGGITRHSYGITQYMLEDRDKSPFAEKVRINHSIMQNNNASYSDKENAIAFFIDLGAKHLVEKFEGVNYKGGKDIDKTKPENWYTAIIAYNGIYKSNAPLYKSDKTGEFYPEIRTRFVSPSNPAWTYGGYANKVFANIALFENCFNMNNDKITVRETPLYNDFKITPNIETLVKNSFKNSYVSKMSYKFLEKVSEALFNNSPGIRGKLIRDISLEFKDEIIGSKSDSFLTKKGFLNEFAHADILEKNNVEDEIPEELLKHTISEKQDFNNQFVKNDTSENNSEQESDTDKTTRITRLIKQNISNSLENERLEENFNKFSQSILEINDKHSQNEKNQIESNDPNEITDNPNLDKNNSSDEIVSA